MWPAPVALLMTVSCGGDSTPLPKLFTPTTFLPIDNPLDSGSEENVGLAVADFNGDGITDLATGYASGWPAALVTNGLFPIQDAGTWGYAGVAEEQGFAAGDFIEDGFGFVDAVVTIHAPDGNWVSVLEYFSGKLLASFPLVPLAGRPTQVVVGDWNGDGHVDVAVLEPLDHAIQILVGDGAGGLALPTASVPTLLQTGLVPLALVAADFTGDGALDLAVTNGVAGTISVFENVGGGQFASTGEFAALPSARSLAAGDLDGDGDIDLVAPGANDDEVAVLFGAGDGTFGGPAFVAMPADSVATLVALADFDGDGDLDLAVALEADAAVRVLRNDGSGNFAPFPFASANSSTGGHGPAQELVAADVTGDGRPDLVLLVHGHFVVLHNAFGG
jgi:hypothetical protein